ncbi:hypothetical protein CYMTET_37701 [Cymbomonas tetramitiformis]|uniref:Uncharacterized protein n=1 Tax=Cymbomonas tetramitiformis TaxID=36881 RepID=A0AAE0F5Z2_9CHLO|nr:hypothetical protein CYMTET_37701 [Cymbomonas tetramitiformis]
MSCAFEKWRGGRRRVEAVAGEGGRGDGAVGWAGEVVARATEAAVGTARGVADSCSRRGCIGEGGRNCDGRRLTAKRVPRNWAVLGQGEGQDGDLFIGRFQAEAGTAGGQVGRSVGAACPRPTRTRPVVATVGSGRGGERLAVGWRGMVAKLRQRGVGQRRWELAEVRGRWRVGDAGVGGEGVARVAAEVAWGRGEGGLGCGGGAGTGAGSVTVEAASWGWAEGWATAAAGTVSEVGGLGVGPDGVGGEGGGGEGGGLGGGLKGDGGGGDGGEGGGGDGGVPATAGAEVVGAAAAGGSPPTTSAR